MSVFKKFMPKGSLGPSAGAATAGSTSQQPSGSSQASSAASASAGKQQGTATTDKSDAASIRKSVSTTTTSLVAVALGDDDADRDDDLASIMTAGGVVSELPVLDDGMDVFMARSREWFKAVKIFLGLVERRAQSEAEQGKTLARVARQALDAFLDLDVRGEGSHAATTLALLKQQEIIALRQLDFGNALTADVMAPLIAKRDQHEKSRRKLQSHLQKEQKKYEDSIAILAKSKQKYFVSVQTWEKALVDKKYEESSAYKVRLDKRTKEEEEAKSKMNAAEEAYRTNIKNTNAAQEEFKRSVQAILLAFERLIVDSESKYKDCLQKFFSIQQTYVDDLPGMTKALGAQSAAVDNKADFHKYVSQVSRNVVYNPPLVVFERAPKTAGNYDPGTRAATMFIPEDTHIPGIDSSAAHATAQTAATPSTSTPASASASGNVAAANIPKERLHKFMKQFAPGLCQHCHQLTFRGIVCEKCGICCHKNCVEKLQTSCAETNKAEPAVLVVFGVPLDEQPCLEGSSIPLIIESCVKEVELRGMDSEGIYRIAGVKSSVEKLGAAFEHHGKSKAKLDLSFEPDINAITGCLKAFLRQLPEPVIPYDDYNDVIEAAGLAGYNEEKLAQLIGSLPKVNYDTLVYLVKHLCNVAKGFSVNKMQASNLAIIFGPSLLHTDTAQEDSGLAFQENGRQCLVVERLVLNWGFIESKAAVFRTHLHSNSGSQAATPTSAVPSTAAPHFANTRILELKGEDGHSGLPTRDSPTSLTRQRSLATHRMSVFDDEEDDDFNVEEFERLSRIVQRNMSFSGAHDKEPSADAENVTIVSSAIRGGISLNSIMRTLSSTEQTYEDVIVSATSSPTLEAAKEVEPEAPEEHPVQPITPPSKDTLVIKTSTPVATHEAPSPLSPTKDDVPPTPAKDAAVVVPPPPAKHDDHPPAPVAKDSSSSSGHGEQAAPASAPAVPTKEAPSVIHVPVASTPVLNLALLQKKSPPPSSVSPAPAPPAVPSPDSDQPLPPPKDEETEEDLMAKVKGAIQARKHK